MKLPFPQLTPLLLLLLLVPPISPFNLETKGSVTFQNPTEEGLGRASYFGFAVALQKNGLDNSAWLLVGAPRANSSYYMNDRITEPGALFKCNVGSSECEELNIDQSGNGVSMQNTIYAYQDLKNNGWLGMALDSQPNYKEDRQATAVCAPRWRNQYYKSTYLVNGVCYWLNSSLPNDIAHKKYPLVDEHRQTFKLNINTSTFFYSHGQVGFSINFPDNQKEIILGAPGVMNWRGTIVRLQDKGDFIGGIISRKRRETEVQKARETRSTKARENGSRKAREDESTKARENESTKARENESRKPRQIQTRIKRQIESMKYFGSASVPNTFYTRNINDFDLMGYSVSSGRYMREDELLYSAGAPRGEDSFGKVIIFTFPTRENLPLLIRQEWKGDQLGANFGASISSGDFNGDGLSDLIVGEPMFEANSIPDLGRVRIILSKVGGQMEISNTVLHGNRVSFGRFGTTLSAIGDLNADGFDDFAVGAPFEDAGAVYIFLGSGGNIQTSYSQRLSPQDFTGNLQGFGMALSRGIDVDDNDYPDLAIGSFLSGHATVIRSRPVAKLRSEITTDPLAIKLEAKTFRMKSCIQYRGKGVPQKIGIRGNISVDPHLTRVQFSDTKNNQQSFTQELRLNSESCLEYSVDIIDITATPHDPIILQMDYELTEDPTLDLIRQPILDPNAASGKISRVSIVTGCEEDGNDICRTDMRMETNFINYGQDQRLVIGGDSKPVLKVAVSNFGEPAFQPNLTIQVLPPLSLNMPSSHDCTFGKQGDRKSLICQLNNPITSEIQDTVEISVDASQLSDSSSELGIRVAVAAEGEEATESLNNVAQALQLEAKADITLQGYSNDEQIRYSLDEKGKVNSTTTPRVLHVFSLVKSGPTPVQEIALKVDIPVAFKDGHEFLKIFAPTANFLGQPIRCEISGGEFEIDTPETEDNGNVVTIAPSDKVRPTTLPTTTKPTTTENPNTENGNEIIKAANFNCSNDAINCATIICNINGWPSGTESVGLEFLMEFDLNKLISEMPVTAGAVFKSFAVATINSLNPALLFTGERTRSLTVTTQIQPESLIGRGVPWWIILLAVLGGLLLLALVAYGLHKAGFFQRKEQEEMKAQRARVEPNPTGYGAANEAMVRD